MLPFGLSLVKYRLIPVGSTTMRSLNDFSDPRVRLHGREHAETAVEVALLLCEAYHASDAQLADLVDAAKALRAGQYRVAVAIAEALIEKRPKLEKATRPAKIARLLAKVRSLLEERRTRSRLDRRNPIMLTRNFPDGR